MGAARPPARDEPARYLSPWTGPILTPVMDGTILLRRFGLPGPAVGGSKASPELLVPLIVCAVFIVYEAIADLTRRHLPE